MSNKKKEIKKSFKLCKDCVHLWICNPQNCGNMQDTDATTCSNYETVYDFIRRVKPLLKDFKEFEDSKFEGFIINSDSVLPHN